MIRQDVPCLQGCVEENVNESVVMLFFLSLRWNRIKLTACFPKEDRLMIAEFTAEEQRALAPFFTNLDRSVFGLKLPQEVAGALFSRYSRSTKSLRRTFFDEFLGDPELGLKDLLGAQTSASDDSAALKESASVL